MEILVDYDNIETLLKRQGIVRIVEKILARLDAQLFIADKIASFRLYGGWYEHSSLTRRAQLLCSDIQAAYPDVKRIALGMSDVTIKIQVELAYSLVAEPQKHLFYTYRRRELPKGLYCTTPSERGCSHADCPLLALPEFIQDERCPKLACSMDATRIWHRAEQKLVDTMLTADIIYFANQHAPALCLVSSDDDFWPGIRIACLTGTKVIHIHAKSGHRTRFEYKSGVGARYTELRL